MSVTTFLHCPNIKYICLQIQQLMNPVLGPRDAQTRQGIKPIDHARSNAQAVKEASQLNALRKAAAEAQQNAKAPGTAMTCWCVFTWRQE